MSKIKIISQAEQGVVIDISGCTTFLEARSYLTSTLQVSSQFWQGIAIDLNLGSLVIDDAEASELFTILKGVGVTPRCISSDNPHTVIALRGANARDTAGSARETAEPVGSRAAQLPPAAETAVELEPASPSKTSTAVLDEVPVPGAEKPGQDKPEPDNVGEQEIIVIESALPSLELTSSHPRPASAEEKTDTDTDTNTEPESKQPETRQKERVPAVLYLKQHLRSGQAIAHEGHLVIVGDVNPGAELSATGDITVWGTLRGMAHAGSEGDTQAEIRALRFEAIQLRIAGAIARAPDRKGLPDRGLKVPETARVVDGRIRISAYDPE